MATEIIKITEKAMKKIHEIQEDQSQASSVLRVAVNMPSPAAFAYDLSFVETSAKSENDQVQEVNSLVI